MEDPKKETAPAKNNYTQPLQEGLQQEAKNPGASHMATVYVSRVRSLRVKGNFVLYSLETFPGEE